MKTQVTVTRVHPEVEYTYADFEARQRRARRALQFCRAAFVLALMALTLGMGLLAHGCHR